MMTIFSSFSGCLNRLCKSVARFSTFNGSQVMEKMRAMAISRLCLLRSLWWFFIFKLEIKVLLYFIYKPIHSRSLSLLLEELRILCFEEKKKEKRKILSDSWKVSRIILYSKGNLLFKSWHIYRTVFLKMSS